MGISAVANIKTSPFEIITYPTVVTDHKLIGMFDVQYKFEDDWTQTEENIMDAWLCHNCTKNFIFSKESHQLIAGGCANNVTDWEYRNSVIGSPNEIYSEFFVKLYNDDRMLFEMVWLSHLK